MNKIFYLVLAIYLTGITCPASIAQSTVTFSVDMSTQLKDSTLVPSQDEVAVAGNQTPFSSRRSIEMKDEAPIDSIYVARVQFPSFVSDKKLSYNFLIRRRHKKINEQNNRSLIIGKKDDVLPVAGFDERFR
jgi:hypothetical protein